MKLLSGRITDLPTAVAWGGSIDEETYLYKAYDERGGLLYVGMTHDLLTRLANHIRQRALWVPLTASVEWELYPSREEAAVVERRLIRTGRPRHNRRLNS